MSSINISPLAFGKKLGLLISDTDVELITWKKGLIENVAVFANDEAGLSRFSAFLDKNADAYKGFAFRALLNIIGEDYRIERVAHLIGKFKADFHNRRMQQLFRGISMCMAFVQGREERGRREDIVLFYGMLTEGKVLPWLRAITQRENYMLEGAYPVAFVNLELLKKVRRDWRKTSTLLMTLHEKGLFRQTYYENGHVRFSRVSKVVDETAQDISNAVRKELERTVQYLTSLKIPLTAGLDIHFVCPSDLAGQVRELLKSSEKIRFTFHDAGALGSALGLQLPMKEFGRDSSLSMQTMFTRMWFRQLAPFSMVRYSWLRSAVIGLSSLFIIWGVIGILSAAGSVYEVFTLRTENDLQQQRLAQVTRQYNEQIGQLEDPPSSPENITAVSQVFRVLTNFSIVPGQIIYYFASAFEKNRRIQLLEMRWYLVSDPAQPEGDAVSLVKGEDIYQVLEVSGEFLPLPNETYLDVANRADILLNSFSPRSDIDVQIVELPARNIGTDNLTGVLTDEYNVEAARSRVFRFRIVWKQYDEERITEISNREA